MAEVGEELEFLLQLGADSSRKEIVTERKGAVKMIEKETQRHFQHEGEVVLFGLSAEKPGAATYILQRWSSKWTEYVDVTSCDDIHDRDKLRVVSKSSIPQPKGDIARAISACSDLAKPREKHAKYLSTLFPGSAGSSAEPSTSTFNPTREVPNFRLKCKPKGSRNRPFKLWVVVGRRPFSAVPKANVRRMLNRDGRVKKVEFRRSMTKTQVKSRVVQAFPRLQLDRPTFMKCVDLKMVPVEVDGGGYPTGSAVLDIASKESLYMVESSSVTPMSEMPTVVGPAVSPQKSAVEELMEQADEVVAKLRAPIECSSDSDGESAPMESLEEWRRIRAEQDSAYEESMAIDRKKALLSELRQELEEEDFETGSISVSFRFSDCRVDHAFPSTASVKELYQFVMAKCKLDEPFTIYRVLPRAPIPFSDTTTLASLDVDGSLLTHELNRDVDFFEFFRGLHTAQQHGMVSVGDKKMGDCTAGWSAVIDKAETSRKAFVADVFKGKLSLSAGSITIERHNIYSDALVLYSTNPKVVNQFPIEVTFKHEDGVDMGGVTRDFFSAFWEEAYAKLFDGAALVAPVSHADVDVSQFAVLGKILSHGYLCCGFLPTRIAFPVLALVLLGLSTTITRDMFVKFFLEFLSQVDHRAIAVALEAKEFTQITTTRLISILSRFGCRDVPTPQNLEHLLYALAQHQFRSQAFAALSQMNGGIPDKHRPFWQAMELDELCLIFESVTANPEKVLEHIVEPLFTNPNEERVFAYLQQYIGEMKVDEAKRFLRFVGSSVLTSGTISVSFNALAGAARRPISHTCSSELDLPHTYSTYVEFAGEFTSLLGSEECWFMNSL